MLDSMRQNAKSLQVFFWLVIAAFVIAPLVGVFRSSSGKPGTQNAAAVVNGEPISFTSLEQQYRNLYNFYRQIYGDNLTDDVLQNLGLEHVALDQLIEQALLVQGARQYQLQVSEAELVKAIHTIPQFQKDGRFDPETYTTLLTRSRLTPQDFELRMEEDLLAQKIEHLIKDGVRISDQEVRSEYLADNEKVRVEGVLVNVQQFVEAVEVTDEEVAAYYDAHKDAFTTPQRMKIRYIAFQPETFAQDLTITEEAIQAYYATHEAEFDKGKEIRARHILLSLTPDTPEAEALSMADMEAAVLQEANEIRQLLDEGQDFAALAEIYSDDPGSAANGGDLGFFSQGMMVPEFETAAFALEPGAVSEPIKTQFGYHLIKVDEVREDQDPYATAQPIIAERLKTEQAKTLAQQQADTVYQDVLDGKDLQQVADAAGLNVMTSGFFAQGEPIDEALGVNWQLQSAALKLSTLQRLSKPVETTAGYYLLELLETQAPYVPELADAADDVKEAVTKQKARELAMAETQKLQAALQSGATTWADVTADPQVKTIAPTPFSRRQQYISEFGSKTETIIPLAFALQEQEISAVIELSDAYGVLLSKEKIAIDEAVFAEQQAELTERVLSQKQNLVFDEFVEDLKQQAEIRISELLQKSDA